MNHFCIDIETAGLESTCIVLSVAIVYFSLEEDVSYEELKQRALYIKLDAKDQATNLKRSVTKSTLEWWNEQTDAVKALAIKPHPNDMPASSAINYIKEYIRIHGSKDSFLWQRGTLDSTALESLCRVLDIESIANYNRWMDVRTAIRCLKSTCNDRAYCTIPDFDPIVVDKHHPVDDVCYDVMMLKYGI